MGYPAMMNPAALAKMAADVAKTNSVPKPKRKPVLHLPKKPPK